MWHSPSNSDFMQSISALSDCSIMLYVLTERWPKIKRYRDAFHAIKRSILNLITNEKTQQPQPHSPSQPQPQSRREKLPAAAIGDLWPGLNHLDFDSMEHINFDDLDQMMNDMTREGTQFSTWDDVYNASGNDLNAT